MNRCASLIARRMAFMPPPPNPPRVPPPKNGSSKNGSRRRGPGEEIIREGVAPAERLAEDLERVDVEPAAEPAAEPPPNPPPNPPPGR